MARRDARLATRTLVEVDAEGVLLALLGFLDRQQRAIVLGLRGQRVALVKLREARDGRQRLLLLQIGVQQRQVVPWGLGPA